MVDVASPKVVTGTVTVTNADMDRIVKSVSGAGGGTSWGTSIASVTRKEKTATG